MSRRAVAAILAALAISCTPRPQSDALPPRWAGPTGQLPRFASPSSAALTCPGARNATAWLPQGTWWNGDVELALFAGDGTPLRFGPLTNLEPGIALYQGEAVLPGATLRAVAFCPWRTGKADTAAWTWIALEVRGLEGAACTVRLEAAVRSGGDPAHYIDPRSAPADSFIYALEDRQVLRDGRVIAIFPRGEDTGSSKQGRVGYAAYAGRRSWTLSVPAGGSATLRLALAPLGGEAPGRTPPGWSEPVARVFQETAATWRKELARGARFTFPDPLWERTFAAARGLTVTDYELHGASRAPLGNPLQYRDFYLRDGARVVRALDLLDRADLAAEGINQLYEFQWPTGPFLSQRGQLDGTGQALWALDQHLALTGDKALLARHGEAALRGAAWIASMRAATRSLGGRAAGLMPYSDPRDNELLRGHLLGTDAWSLCALTSAARIARRLGQDPVPWDSAATSYRRDLLAVWDRESARQGRPLPPAVENGARDWGNLSAVYPCDVFDAADPRILALDRWLHERLYTDGLLTFGSRDSIHHYATFDLTQARLRRGDRAGTLVDIQGYLDHTLPDGTGFEYRDRRSDGYGENLPPHGTFAAMWIELARDCVLYEDGDSLVLLAGIPAAWLEPGAADLKVQRAPTAFGPASISLGKGVLAFDLPAPARVVFPDGFVGGAAGRAPARTVALARGTGSLSIARAGRP